MYYYMLSYTWASLLFRWVFSSVNTDLDQINRIKKVLKWIFHFIKLQKY